MLKRRTVCESPPLPAYAWLAAAATAVAAAADPPRYAIIQIDPVAGNYTTAWDVNEHGSVAGTTTYIPIDPSSRAYSWNKGSLNLLGALDGSCCSEALNLNESNSVVGQSRTSNFGVNLAFLWRNGELTNLGALGWNKWSEAWGINNHDEIVGGATYKPDNFATHAFLWRDGVMTDLGVLNGVFSVAYDINDTAQVIGWSDTSPVWPYRRHAFFWQDGVMVDLGTFGGASSQALDMNELGEVVGLSDNSLDQDQAFLWREGQMTSLHDDPTRTYSGAVAINNLGVIIGSFWNYDDGQYFAIWDTPESPSRPLLDDLPPDHGWDVWWFTDLNDAGQIVGEGDNRYGQHRGFMLTPVEHEFELAAPTPGVAGQVNEIIASGLEPGERVYFVYSQRGGGTMLPMCELLDATLQLDDPQIIASVIADASGEATLSAFVPDAARSMGDILIQAVVPSSCKVSELRIARFR